MKIKFLIYSPLLFFFVTNCTKKNESDRQDTDLVKEVSLQKAIPQEELQPEISPQQKEEDEPSELAAFSFEEKAFNFGEIIQGSIVEHLFKFTNSGTVPLVITGTHVTCGCTTPRYTKEPIPVGGTGEILVKFNSRGKSGTQNKRVTLKANVKGGSDYISISSVVKVIPKDN